jgi:hypothetical protein
METTFQFVSDPELEESFGQSDNSASVLVPGKELKSFSISSPDCRDTLSIVFDKPDFSAERVHVLITPASSTAAIADYRFDFDLTSFAFPFTDNAVLPSGNRFAFFIKDVSELDDTGTSKIMRVGLRWFPQNYYPPTERPTDYKEFRKALGRSGASSVSMLSHGGLWVRPPAVLLWKAERDRVIKSRPMALGIHTPTFEAKRERGCDLFAHTHGLSGGRRSTATRGAPG